MTPFIILSLGEFIEGSGIKLAMQAFANFYESLSSKHQARVELNIVEKYTNIESLQNFAQQLNIQNAVKFLKLDSQEAIEQIYKNSTVFFLPSKVNMDTIIQEALSYNLPLISFEHKDQAEYVDLTCSMLLDSESDGESIIEFSHMLQMLYFDPEVGKLLKRGAMRQYEAHFTWAKKKRARIGA